jgi:hypothetical protein
MKLDRAALRPVQLEQSRGRLALVRRRAAKPAMLVAAVLALTCTGGAAVAASGAQAYYWGCTASVGSSCWGKLMGVSTILGMDQNTANYYVERNPENGYPHPSGGHPHRSVCINVWGGNQLLYPWNCASGSVAQNSGYYAEPMLGENEGGAASLYELVNEIP